MASESAFYLKVGPGGICFAHGPYGGQYCPRYENNTGIADCACVTDPQKPEYVALAQEKVRQTNKVYTQSQLDEAVKAERERSAKIAENHYVDHKASDKGLIHQGQCHQAIAAAIREDDKDWEWESTERR